MKDSLADIPDWQSDFKNPEYEGRRLIGEVLGTFLLALVGIGAHVVDIASKGDIGRVAAVVAHLLRGPGAMKRQGRNLRASRRRPLTKTDEAFWRLSGRGERVAHVNSHFDDALSTLSQSLFERMPRMRW